MTKPENADEGVNPINCYRALPHELFVWCVENGMPEGECQTAKEQIKWIKWYVQRLRNKIDEAECIKRRFCDVVPLERLIEQSDLDDFEKWARDAVLKFGTKEQLDWTNDKYVLLALQILPGLITKYKSEK